MRIPRIHCEQDLAPDRELALDEGAAGHVARVLRMTAGESLELFDGAGRACRASIVAADRRQVRVRIDTMLVADRESPLAIHLGIGISRGERMDWVVQKATELGVAAITPLFTSRTEVKLAGERADRKLRHWRQVLISACEQCGRNRLPALHSTRELGDWLAACDQPRRFVLHHRAGAVGPGGTAPTSVALLVGPEGGLAAEEIGQAEALGFEALALGPRVLRTETAPLAALAILQARWGDMAAVGAID